MKKRMKRILALGLTAMLLLVGCGPSGLENEGGGQDSAAGNTGTQGSAVGNEEGQGGQKVMGRYMESPIELPEEIEGLRDLRLAGEGAELIAWDGSLYRSQDQGQSWQLERQAPEEVQQALNMGVDSYYCQNRSGSSVLGYIQFHKDEEGNTDFENSSRLNLLFLADGSRIPLEGLEQEYINTAVWDENGYFYLGSSDRVYRVNGQDGSMEVLTELSTRCDYLTVCGQYLMIQGEDLQIYDLAENKMGEEDPVLNEFIKPWLGQYGDVGSRAYLMYLSPREEKSLYLVTDKGLYRHTLYGSTVEQLIDGSLCSMGNSMLGLVGVLQMGDAFWVAFSGGHLKQYIYDPTASAMPENLMRVWGLYADEDVERVVSAFAQSHPDLYITYEHPLSEDTGMTKEDALKVLSTELATGNGPDVLLLDGLSYDTYVEKGVLADLTATLEGTGERYVDAVRTSYQRDGGQYAMPMAMSLPVLMGARDQIQNAASLADLADLAEAARASRPQGFLFGFSGAREALELLAIGSSDSWMNENGGINKEAVQEFLTLARRIYDAQISGITVREAEAMEERQMLVDGRPVIRTDAGYQLGNAMFFGSPYAMGLVNNSLSVMGSYSIMAVELELLDMALVPMSGQSRNMGKASNILAVNETSKVKEQALELVAYALSTRFCQENYLLGGTVNWDVLEAQVRKEQEEEMESCIGFEDINGKEYFINVGVPSQEDIDTLRQLMESCQGISKCDSRVYEAVVEEGQKALNGELTVEEAVKEIKKKVTLYLAE